MTSGSFVDHRELARLYRRHTTRLARARTRGRDPDLIRHLNALCVRAHSVLYAATSDDRGAPGRIRERIADAVALSFVPIATAWLLLALGCFVGAALASRDPAAVFALVPSELGYSGTALEDLVQDPAARSRFLEPGEVPTHQNAFFGSMLFARNTRVGLLAFALGILAGLPTVLLQIYNGVIVGALSWVFMRGGTSADYLAWILPHGVPEFTAIVLCAAGGLTLGAAIAAPGRRGRRRALADAVDTALLLILASLPLFLVAAGIESFVRESSLGRWPRFVVAGLNLTLLLGAMIWLQRRARRTHSDRSWLHELNHVGADRGSG